MGFSQTDVITTIRDERLVTWWVDGSTKLPDPIEFYVDRARSGGEFEQLAGPLANVCVYVDLEPFNWNKDKNTFYRIRYRIGDSWVTSDPIQANGSWSRQDYLYVRELFRKECLRQREVGVPGMLFKQREWGSACPRCADFDTKQPADGQCPICYGTGIDHGFYEPIALTVDLNPLTSERKESDLGTVQPDVIVGRAMHYPMISSFDVWVSITSNARYRIRKVTNVAEWRGRPLIANLELRLIPQTDVLYMLGTEIPVSSEPANDAWNQLNVV